MAGRARLYYSALANAGQSQSINLDETLPFNATLLQITATLSADPENADVITLEKKSALGTKWDVVLRTFAPGVEALTNIICNEHFEFRKGDRVSVAYTNSADIDVAIELVFKEAD